MSYWSQNSALSSQLDDLLSKEDVSLREVMDEAEVLQECKSQNKKLIDYLARLDVLKELISLTTSEPAEENVDAVRYKYPSIACELLTSELPQIIRTLASEQFLLAELYAFLEGDSPLNPLLASFFSRIMGVLISKNSEENWFSYQVSCLQVLEFLKSKGNCVALLLKHIGTSAIMDLILKMYTKIEGEIRNNFLTWLDEAEFLEQLVAQLNPDSSAEVRSNVCQLLCDLVLTSRENASESTKKFENDRIAEKIESEEFVKRLLEQMLLEPRCEGSIVGGISVLLTLLENRKRDEYQYASWNAIPIPEASTVTDNTVAAIVPHLTHVLDILRNPPPKPIVRTTVGTLDPPLGATRVEVVRLLAALVATGHHELPVELQRQDLLNVMLDLFFQYPWNNFLHAQVEATLIAAFKSSALLTHILSSCNLLQRIMDAWHDNDTQEKNKKPRRGYMGHVIRISNHIVEETGKTPLDAASVASEIVESEILSKWQEFVATDLAKVNGDQSNGMGFKLETQEESGNEELYQELYKRYYQLQALATPFADNFCVEQLENNDDNGSGLGGPNLKPGFPGGDSETNDAEREELFTQVCAQKMQALDDDAEMWSNIMQDREARAWNDEGSSDEEAGGGNDEDADDWPETVISSGSVEQNNPWSADVLSANSPPDQGWANFEALPFFTNYAFDLSSTIATSAPGEVERVPFDLTPTETQLFPLSDASDWPGNPPPSSDMPSNWPVTPPSETPPSDVETPPADKEESPPSLPGAALSGGNPASGTEANNSSTEFGSFIGAVVGMHPVETADGNNIPSQLSDTTDSEMETAPVLDTENIAEIVNVSDIMNQYEELKLGVPFSSCPQDDMSQSSSVDTVIAAFPSETVIKQTEALDIPEGAALPSNIPSTDVASQLAELLAEVSVSDSNITLVNASECRTFSETGEVTNGSGDAGDCDAQNTHATTLPPYIETLNNSRNESPNQVSVADNDELHALQENSLLPKLTTSIVMREEAASATATPNDPVTAI